MNLQILDLTDCQKSGNFVSKAGRFFETTIIIGLVNVKISDTIIPTLRNYVNNDIR